MEILLEISFVELYGVTDETEYIYVMVLTKSAIEVENKGRVGETAKVLMTVGADPILRIETRRSQVKWFTNGSSDELRVNHVDGLPPGHRSGKLNSCRIIVE